MTQALMEAPQRGAMQKFDGNIPAANTPTLKGMLEASKDKLSQVVPKHLNPDKLMRVALVAVSRSELLQKCTVSSILQCVMTGAQLGLDCSGVLGSAYMVPFYNGKTRRYEATFICGYRGLIDLARRSGEIEDISANVVYANDRFDFELGAQPRLIHKPDFTGERDDDKIVGAYMVAFLKGNERPHLEFMTRGQLLKIRDGSKSYLVEEWRDGKKTGKKTPAGPWHHHFAEMCRKTVVRRGVKYLPMSVDLADALSAEDDLLEDEPQVLAAATESPAAQLTRRIIGNRPPSEGQTLEPSDEAIERAAQEYQEEGRAEHAAESHAADATDKPEPDVTSIVDAEPPETEAKTVPEFRDYAHFKDAMNEAAQDLAISPTDLDKMLRLAAMGIQKKGKENQISKETLKLWYADFLAGEGKFKRG